MDKFGKSQSTTRVEDIRFLTGGGRYVDDTAPADALHAFVLRSQVAHGTLGALDLDEARAMPGVHLVLDADTLQAEGVQLDIKAATVKNRDGTDGAAPERPILARGKVRFVGEPIAVVIAETLDQARDAAEAIWVEIDDLPAKIDVAPGGETLHEVAPDNVAFDWGLGDEAATEAAFAKAAHRVRLLVDDNRVIVNAMEPRGCWAEMEGDRLHVSFNGQGVWVLKDRLSQMLNMPKEQIRVTNPDVGGGFGMKAMTYPEYYAVAQATRMLNRPVRWMSERTEAMLSDNAGRDLVTVAEMAFDENLRITAYRTDTLANMGAYNSQFAQPIQTQLFTRVFTGVYDIQTIWCACKGIYTNTTQVDAYRGAGRPEAIYVLERVMDHAARQLGVDPLELRRRNFIPAAAFPYKTAVDETYDVGDFVRVLGHASETADIAGFAARKAASARAGKLRGLGLCYYIESILGDPSETAKVEFHEDGTVTIYVGTQSNGQGHETVYAKFLSDHTGIPLAAIRVVQGDSDLIRQGGGTGGSRSVTVQNTATLATVGTMVTGFADYLADKMGAEGPVEFDDERFRIPGSNETPSMLEVAAMAREDGRHDLLTIEERTTLPARSFPNGAHFAEVEIDQDTGVTEVVKYTVVDDFGNLINPMLAEGQVHGGVVQGIGQAVTERVVYNEDGQLLTATFMDYAMPRASDVPALVFETEPVPSTSNPMGMKGCGEAGTVGALAAVANAVQDAVWDRGVRQVDMPFTPLRMWEMLKGHAQAAE